MDTNAKPPSLKARTIEAIQGLLSPWLFLNLSASFLPAAITHILSTHSLPAALHIILLSPSRFREAWFGQFWTVAGPQVREGASPRVVPLLDGRTSAGQVTERPVHEGVGGVVLEIGSGAGYWVDLFSERHLYENPNQDSITTASSGNGEEKEQLVKRENTARTKITHVYGVEPNASHHEALRRAVAAAGLDDIYEIVPVGIEDLSSVSPTNGRKKWDGSIEPGSIDCIVSVLCLCSIPDPKRHIRELYELLRPGGRWYIYEHVRVKYSWYIRLYQRLINIFWPRFIGGCELMRQTEETIRETGPWSDIDVGQPVDEMWFSTVPHVLGVFTK
ncbi:S-adenosyl-L-methionine-dependent methyltransferase [Xylaria venustula]|nr:S-adenosyl-L-methionine-dependent methyltransferase [Xylaria venustula]